MAKRQFTDEKTEVRDFDIRGEEERERKRESYFSITTSSALICRGDRPRIRGGKKGKKTGRACSANVKSMRRGKGKKEEREKRKIASFTCRRATAQAPGCKGEGGEKKKKRSSPCSFLSRAKCFPEFL